MKKKSKLNSTFSLDSKRKVSPNKITNFDIFKLFDPIIIDHFQVNLFSISEHIRFFNNTNNKLISPVF